ncbi:exosome complex component RRP42-like [Mizuhopecten yessoensis]|uniref:Exosome component 7 n=1 Tax=Mizuhopecten yessoensis TaxID=6573 RepID=A0A210R233_MIZYE|nr:exosome complex component RRP42-like [Mizuhopecten yessoensis]OWF55143.1 Exosome complex component RRP42 [Mizuhopecten yessoensis]
MVDVQLSDAEKVFILHGVQDNCREDGRGCEDYRHLEIETSVMSNTNGSARVRLANTDILVGVKAELGTPSPEKLNKGRIEFFVDCSANATPEFEGRGGEDLATDISNMLYRAYDCPNCFDLQQLCVIPDQQCWILYVDILLLECGGNLFDATSLAVKAALFNTSIPTVTVTKDEGVVDLEISDDPYDVQRLDMKSSPCIVTLSKVGHSHVVDASQKEECCTLARLIMGVTEKGTITALKKEGSGSLDPTSIEDMMETGRRVGESLNKCLMDALAEEERQGTKKKSLGFLR